MNIKVDEINNKAIIEFGHDDFVICESDNKDLGDYSLNYRIYLDYKDSVQAGMPVMYIDSKDADRLEKILDRFW